MGFDECYQLGNVVKTHGLQGELVFFLDVDDPSVYKELESVFIDINGKLVPFFIKPLLLQGDRMRVSIEDIHHIDEAKELIGKSIYLPLKSLPKLSSDQYYYHDLIGFNVFDVDQLIGKVLQVYEMPTNYLLSVDHKETEVLIPIEDEIVIKVDLEQQQIITNLPEGLLDVYLEK